MTLEEFKLKQYRALHRDLSSHKLKMQAYRAVANPITLGFLDALEDYHESLLNTYNIRIRLYSPRPKDVPNHFVTSVDIARAKSVPISTFLKFGLSNKVKCLFHNDKTASLHIFTKNNTWYCFGECNKGGSVIDLYMKLNNCNFITAVKRLSNK